MQDALDNANYVAEKDPFNALQVVANAYQQVTATLTVEGNTTQKVFSNIVVTGMGGSALAAGVAKDWLNMHVPFEIVRNYDLPAYIGPDTLVIASSYSGNTEETIAAYAQAKEKGAVVAVIASGGRLIELAEQHSDARVVLASGIQPRMAVFSNLRALVLLLEAYGVVEGRANELASLELWLKGESERWVSSVPTDMNLAKQLACFAVGKTPVIYAGVQMRSIAYKWKISFNENAKNVAFNGELPEFNHNEFIGWTSHPVDKPFAVFDLRSSFEHERIGKRFELSDKLLSGRRPKAYVVELEGDSVLAEMLWGAVLADFVSIYVAILNGVDPTKVELIEKFKKELS